MLNAFRKPLSHDVLQPRLILSQKCRKSRNAFKIYRYSYIPDPRKFAPIEATADEELFPRPLRPPHAEVPDVATFLQRISTRRTLRCMEYASVFRDWEHLMTITWKEMRMQGIPNNVRMHILNWQERYRRGDLPMDVDSSASDEFWEPYYARGEKGNQTLFPEMPENYRPHQQGIASRPIKDLQEANKKPEWAIKEETRLRSATD